MRVLHAYKIYKPDVEGGIPHVITSLTQPIESDIESSILVARPRGLTREFKQGGVPVKASAALGTAFSMPLSPNYVLALHQHAANVDLIVHHAPFPLTDLALTMSRTKARLIVHWHAEILNRSFLKALVAPAIRRTLARADRIVVSHPTIVEQSEFLGPFRNKCVAIPYGVDFDYWSSLTPEQTEQITQMKKSSPHLIVAIGRLVSYKGLSILLQAMQGVNAKLVIIGEGPLISELEALARRLDVARKTIFAGRLTRDAIKLYLHAASVFAMPSVSSAEAFGIVQLEAMSAGCPVINTALPTAVPFIARHEEEALTIPVNDVHALNGAIVRILNDPDLAIRLSNAGRLRAKDEFDEPQFRRKNFTLYRDVVGS